MSVDKNKPFVQMDDLESTKAWDDIMGDTDSRILEAARKGEDQELVLTLAILTLPSGERRVSYWNAEYGDGENRSYIGDFIRRIRRLRVLKKGEKLERFKAILSFDNLRLIPDPLPVPKRRKAG